MIVQLAIGGLLIALTVIFQALLFDFIIKKIRWLEGIALERIKDVWKAVILAFVVLAVFGTLIAEIWLWALFYLAVGAFAHLEPALYYSISSFTTVGFGDVVLGSDWRLIGSIEATNGFLMFGWSTAFIFEVVSRVYRKEGKAIER